MLLIVVLIERFLVFGASNFVAPTIILHVILERKLFHKAFQMIRHSCRSVSYCFIFQSFRQFILCDLSEKTLSVFLAHCGCKYSDSSKLNWEIAVNHICLHDKMYFCQSNSRKNCTNTSTIHSVEQCLCLAYLLSIGVYSKLFPSIDMNSHIIR